MSGWRLTTAAALGVLGLAACGGGARQDANEPSANFPVAITEATFPSTQQLAEGSHLVIAVRNTGSRTIPNIAVTITNPHTGTDAQAFGTLIQAAPGLASRTRPVWIVDQAPGACQYSCQQGGPGAAVTAYSDTWALGRLRPGATATFDWALTAVKSGSYQVAYQVAAGLNGKAKAVSAGNQPVKGEFAVKIATKPRQASVNNNGQIVYGQ